MKEWYLTTPVPNITGFESDPIKQYAQSNFTDVLLTDFADKVSLFNADLSEETEIKCVIQGNTADTQLKSMERAILAPIGTLKSGMYIYFENSYWIIDGRVGNNKAYEKAVLKLCQYKLKWQKSDGSIVERWCNLTSASKYDVGESGNNVLILSSNNYTILIPHDDDGQTIEGKRAFIDTSDNPHKVFKITRNDDPLFLYGEQGGILSLIADKTELDELKDRTDLKLCDYIEPPYSPTPPATEEATISGKKELWLGSTRKYSLSFKGKNWSEVSFSWNVISDFDVSQNSHENIIELTVNDEDAIGSSVVLQVLVDGVVVGQIEILVTNNY